ncbi:thymidylate synthase [Marinobacter sp. NP-6]|uniref:thymidylate synthase n=1 Tax=Marinobacter sp. NP-6 TaxID=2488666 RepID=UPI000FCC988B|nr:thymidylate synthase [Marinobacter sp. NP-6]RUT76884.1 thymidylate synthase [Marinobacter sp. NP-6]
MSENFFKAATLDDLLHEVFEELLSVEGYVDASRGRMKEIFGATLMLTNPRARLSRSESKGKLFSALGELLWYLTGDNDLNFIKYYVGRFYEGESEDGITVRSGYGERMFNHSGSIDQVQNVINLLESRPSSRRAVIQLFDASDLTAPYKSIPCTCTLQFLIRGGELNLLVNMRSNDAFWGLPHDVFAFTMLQEIVARSIGVDVGVYQHCAGSLHLYENKFDEARNYLREGWMNNIAMDSMPLGDPWPAINKVKRIADLVRRDGTTELTPIELEPYWRDISCLLMWLHSFKQKDFEKCSELKKNIKNQAYHIFIEDKLANRQD